MTIVPAGKKRLMEAQSINSPLSQGVDSNIPSFETEDSLEEDIIPGQSNIDQMKEEQEQIGGPENPVEPVSGKKTLTDYIFKKLESFGYPGRRLQEFKSKFVRETVSPDGIKDIQVEIPDKKYPNEMGQTESIENEDLGAISKEVNKLFGLNFNGAERTDGKWTIKFTSAKITNPEEGGGMARDNLEEVYGNPNKTKEEPKRVAAYTLREMIKAKKDGLVRTLKNTIGD